MASFKFITAPGEVSRTDDGLNHIAINGNGLITVCFGNTYIIEIPASCKMYDAPHLICWNEDNSEVGFFAQFHDKYDNGKKKDCMCMISRHRDKADMWFLHGTPSEVILEPCIRNPKELRITPIVNGTHAFKSPFNFDDSQMVACKVIHKVTVKKPSEPSVQEKRQSKKILDNWLSNILQKLQSIDKGVKLRILTFFLLMFSTFTYHAGKMFYLLIHRLSDTPPTITTVFVIESVVLYMVTLLFHRSRFSSWVYVIASALWLGCVIFDACITRQILNT